MIKDENTIIFEPKKLPEKIGTFGTDKFASFKRINSKCFGKFEGKNLVIACSGYSRQGGFEIYLDQTELGGKLWDTLWEAGEDLEVSPGCPNLIERVEGGLLSYGNEMTRRNNPLECNLEKFCDLKGSVQYIGSSRLLEIAEQGVDQRIRGIVFEGTPSPPCGFPWPLESNGQKVGYTTTVVWSPR